MSSCGACTCGAVAARLFTSSLASAQRGNQAVLPAPDPFGPGGSEAADDVRAGGATPGRARGLHPFPGVVRGCMALRPAPFSFAPAATGEAVGFEGRALVLVRPHTDF